MTKIKLKLNTDKRYQWLLSHSLYLFVSVKILKQLLLDYKDKEIMQNIFVVSKKMTTIEEHLQTFSNYGSGESGEEGEEQQDADQDHNDQTVKWDVRE